MKKRSLILITVDCLRADHVGFYGYPRPVTPFLDSLAKKSAVFSDAIVAGVPTYFSFPAILASRYPLALGRDVVGIAPGETTVATVLRDEGYRTGAFLAGNPYLSARFGYAQGFQTFQDFLEVAERRLDSDGAQNGGISGLNRGIESLARKNRRLEAAYTELYFWYCQWRASHETASLDELRPYPSAATMVDRASSWLRENSQEPFFLWIHLMDAHHPNYPPPEAMDALGMSHMTSSRQRFLNSFWNRRDIGAGRLQRYVAEMVPLYDASVRWIDQQVARLVRALQELQVWDEAIFVLTADHGEEFLEHGGRYHSPTSPIEPLIRVPLLIHARGMRPMRAKQGPFSLLHLAPTLTEGLGVQVPGDFQGLSCWGGLESGTWEAGPAILETVGDGNAPCNWDQQMRPRVLTVRDKRHKLILRFNENKCALFDLEKDPHEKAPVPESSSIVERARLLKIARDHLQKTRSERNKDLVLAARLREARHSLIASPPN